MPQPPGAEQPLSMRARCQPRMENVRRLPICRCGKRSTGFCLLQLDAAIVSGAMREQDAAAWIIEQGNGVFVGVRKVEAAVKFTNNPPIMEQKPFRSQPFVDHGKAAIRRCRRGIETVAIIHSCGPLRTISGECTAATDPIDEFTTAPTERADASCVEAGLPKESHKGS
jgi:hypothetical protein